MGDEVKELLHYIGGDKPSSTLTKLLDEEVNNVKSNKKLRREFMTLLMRDKENKLCKAKCMNRFFMHFILLYHTTGVMQNKACVDIIEYAVML